ncbi:CTP:phosphocholine cytidylyltransferase [Selenomonas sp. GACV-9]|uniref:phosphotransferase n=1 Tax=Selenomonas sp. GACV-9 TaxID=3158782 RepID=UPI0008E413C3|nr:CTP:phosphocholine cytidylyltransferase [Selenomonas ruminantium]
MMTEKQFNELMTTYRQQQIDGIVDEKVRQQLAPYRVQNAVIMAAGMSSRFAPLSYEKPKALIRVKGEILIEREIRQLHEAGIREIYLVVGYMKEKFFYLAEKYGVHIVVNEDYYRYNNTSTLMRVAEKLGNTYICSSDNYFTENPFEEYVYRPYYAAVYAEGPTDEYCLRVDETGRICQVDIGGENAWYMLGHVYFDRTFSRRFVEILRREYERPSVKAELWEDLYKNHIDELTLYIRKYDAAIIHEFDSLDELRQFDDQYICNADSEVFRNICQVLACREDEIHTIVPIKFGMTNLSFRFCCRGETYIYRHPGRGTSLYINRKSEAASMKIAKDLQLDNTYIFMDAQSGWKISRYIEQAQTLDYHNWEQVEKALQLLSILHASGRTTDYSFDIWQEITRFQQALKQKGQDDFADMQELAKAIEALRSICDLQKYRSLCHADSYAANFLFDSEGRAALIDWEYSGMADPAVDLGTFVTCSDYSEAEVEKVWQLYQGRELLPQERLHYMAYLAVCSYYWFLWSLYQEANGKSVDQYMYIWYRNAKTYQKRALAIYQEEG